MNEEAEEYKKLACLMFKWDWRDWLSEVYIKVSAMRKRGLTWKQINSRRHWIKVDLLRNRTNFRAKHQAPKKDADFYIKNDENDLVDTRESENQNLILFKDELEKMFRLLQHRRINIKRTKKDSGRKNVEKFILTSIYLEGKTLKEVSKVLGCSECNISRIVKEIRERMIGSER